MDNQTIKRVMYRRLGAAGFELHVGRQSLLIDPYVTRAPWHRMFFWHVRSNRRLVQELIPAGDHILVSHAHIDHLLDVSTVMEHTGASVYGSQNTCRLLQALGAEEIKIHQIETGDQVVLGKFSVSVLSAQHPPVLFFLPGAVPAKPKPPCTARQYRMDTCYSFLIEVGELRILTDSGKRHPQNLPADVLIIHPFYGAKHYQRLLNEVQPKLVIPNHWDNFMPTFSKEIKQGPYPNDLISLLVRRLILPSFSRVIQRYDPHVKVLVPQLFHEYDLRALFTRLVDTQV